MSVAAPREFGKMSDVIEGAAEVDLHRIYVTHSSFRMPQDEMAAVPVTLTIGDILSWADDIRDTVRKDRHGRCLKDVATQEFTTDALTLVKVQQAFLEYVDALAFAAIEVIAGPPA